MTWVIYMFFSGFLYMWTVKSICYESNIPKQEYLLGIILLAIAFIINAVLYHFQERESR